MPGENGNDESAISLADQTVQENNLMSFNDGIVPDDQNESRTIEDAATESLLDDFPGNKEEALSHSECPSANCYANQNAGRGEYRYRSETGCAHHISKQGL
jgi:hypothetical protein